MMKVIKRYKIFLLLLGVNCSLLLFLPDLGANSLSLTWGSLKEMLSVMPAIFILIGLMDIWIDRDTMMKYLGKGSGLRGIAIAFALGTMSGGPLYAAFPVATVMLRKRAGIFQTFVYLGTCSTAKISMLSFELANMGPNFTFVRLGLSIVGIIIIALVVSHSLKNQEKEDIYQLADDTQ